MIKTSLGYDNNQKNIDDNTNLVMPEKKEKPQSYDNVLRGPNHGGNPIRKIEKTTNRIKMISGNLFQSTTEMKLKRLFNQEYLPQ